MYLPEYTIYADGHKRGQDFRSPFRKLKIKSKDEKMRGKKKEWKMVSKRVHNIYVY